MKKIFNIIAGSKKNFPLRHRILNITEFFGLLVFLQATATNYIIRLPFLAVLMPFISFVVISFLFYLSRWQHKYEVPVIISLMFVGFVVGPSLWINGAGLGGSVPFWYVYLVVSAFILTEKFARIFMVTSLFFTVGGLAVMEHYGWIMVQPYDSSDERFWDILTQILLVMYVLVSLVNVIIGNYLYENKKATRFANRLVMANERMKNIINTDTLTGLFTRAYILDKIEYEKTKLLRNKKEFGIIMADIDNFKEINDNLGHSFGDYILKEVANDIRSILRTQDTASRWGGEEFLFLLPDTPLDNSVHVAEKIRETIAKKIYSNGDNDIYLTISMGVSVYNDFTGKRKPDSCIKKADDALHMSKRLGKNMVKALSCT